MTNDFGQRVYPILRYVISVLDQIRNSAGQSPNASEVAAKLRTMLSQFDVAGARRKDFEYAKRALVYWIDEVLVNSNWLQSSWWSDHTMERQFFDSRERAWRFFENAAAARQLENSDALETFYLCACLGFRGIYRDQSESKKSGKAERSLSDTWPELPSVGSEPPASQAGKPPASQAGEPQGKKMPSMSWWENDINDLTLKTWGLSGSAAELDAIAEFGLSPNAPTAKYVETNEIETLSQWIESVYRQLMTAGPGPYSPTGRPSEPGEAAPLTGRSSRTLALLSLFVTGLFFITVSVVALYRT